MRASQALSIVAFALTATCMTIKRQDEQTNLKREGWTSAGCYTDNVSGRALTTPGGVPGGPSTMTNEACQTACAGAGFSWAGTEYGGECWCGNSIINGNGPAPDGNTGCNMACNGNGGQTCGGPNRLTAFQTGGGGSSTPPSNPAPSKYGKRGLAYDSNNKYGDASFGNMFRQYSKVSWGYNWGYTNHGLDSSLDFVPMLWGNPKTVDQNWVTAAQSAKSVLGFNEPDLTYEQSSNMLPEVAAQGYKSWIQPFAGQVRIGGPGVLWNNWNSWSSGGGYSSRVWTQYFMGNCTGCHIDFAAIHYYQDCVPKSGESGTDWFITNITNAHDTLNLPIWITEFQCYGTDEQQAQFLRTVLPWLDSQGYVERYAYFGAFPNFLLNVDGSALSLAGQAYVN